MVNNNTKMGFSSIFKTTPSSTIPTSWAWASCKHPRTKSFRASGEQQEEVYNTVNSIYFDSTDSDQSESMISTSSDCTGIDVIHGLRSVDRLFFEPGGATSSILQPQPQPKHEETIKCKEEAEEEEEEDAIKCPPPFKESVAEEMESENPYLDFRVAMEEMVMAHGLKEWEGLEKLLHWYLKANGRTTHRYIVGAFVDLVLDLASSFATPIPSSSNSCSNTSCCCSSSSSSSSPSPSSSTCVKFVVKEEEDQLKDRC